MPAIDCTSRPPSAFSQNLLLETCIQGLMHELMVKKWDEFASTVYRAHQAVSFVFLALLLVMAFCLKEMPADMGQTLRVVLPLLTLIPMCFLVAYDLYCIWTWYHSQPDKTMNKFLFHELRFYLTYLDFWSNARAYITCSAACTIVLINSGEPHDVYGSRDHYVWPLLAYSIFSEASDITHGLFVSSQRYGVFALVIENVLAADVSTYLIFLMLYLFKFWATLYIVYPRAGEGQLHQVESFNQWYESLKQMFDFSLGTGERFAVDLQRSTLDGQDVSEAISLGDLDLPRMAGIVLFGWYYLWCAVILSILLVRLLMAMMTNTYNGVRNQAVRHWRVQFARCVLQMEMISRNPKQREELYHHEKITKIIVGPDGERTFKLFSGAS